jgi:hypothetical protein
MFPTIYLSLISIIQALALETLWSTLIELDHIWTWTIPALIGWLEITAVFELILLLWLTYVHTIMRVRWVVSVSDSLIPFALGVVEFALVALIHPAKVHLWCYALAAGSAIGTLGSIATNRAMRQEPDNAAYLEGPGLSRPLWERGEHGTYLAAGALALLAGLAVQWQGSVSNLALTVLALGNGALLAMIALEAVLWTRSVET